MKSKTINKINWSRLFLAVLITQGAGGLGALATTPQIGNWYVYLNKPFFSPPNWLFGPVWTVLYLMMGVSLYLGWQKKVNLKWFWVQLGLNTLWSFLFFGLESPGWALVEIAILWIAIVMTIKSFWAKNRIGSYLLLPYLLWVSFASVLNGAIWWLNR